MKSYLKQLIVFTFVILNNAVSIAQVDSIIFNNNSYIIGEVKNLEKGTLIVETDFSDADFTIEWTGVKEIYTKSSFLITLTNGKRYNGSISSNADYSISIHYAEGNVDAALIDIVFLESVDDSFKSRLYAGIDVGFELTKAQNLQSLSIRSIIGYLAERWSTNASLNFLNSSQDDIEPIVRNEGWLDFRY